MFSKLKFRLSTVLKSFTALLSLVFFGLTYGCSTVCYYMAPIVGRMDIVMRDSITSNAIENIRVVLLDEVTNQLNEALSDSNGEVSFFRTSYNEYSNCFLALEDIDGTNNGGTYVSQTNAVLVEEGHTNINYYLTKQ